MSAPRPIRQMRLCAYGNCTTRFNAPHGQPHPAAYCSSECHRLAKQAAAKPPKPRVQMPRTPQAKKRKPVSVASPEQRVKRNGSASIVSGETVGLHAAHLTSRALGGCDHPDCVVALTAEEHRRFDNPGPHERQLDLLPYLVGMHDELAHMLMHYRGDLPAMLERLTGCKWVAVESERRAA